eukprot:CAMPEP_0175289562 /NCGR_PEP_ID=MMETSP0093-20121207/55398_1 /TAXON_ID=311494 /ORGANISM="Alexandrium monilatum, Strain CCMP3105" /LENGTH=120 /DNA_ID=CAMNT_0016585173 /DNA_START=124 /DNA_END=483 /DNA_ORIENTATION=-
MTGPFIANGLLLPLPPPLTARAPTPSSLERDLECSERLEKPEAGWLLPLVGVAGGSCCSRSRRSASSFSWCQRMVHLSSCLIASPIGPMARTPYPPEQRASRLLHQERRMPFGSAPVRLR